MTVEITSREQGDKIKDIKEMDGFPCEICKHPKYNYIRGLIYVHEFDLENVEDFKNGLQGTYNVDVRPATFIKTRSP